MKKSILITGIFLASMCVFFSSYLMIINNTGIFSKTGTTSMLTPWGSVGGCGDIGALDINAAATGAQVANFLDLASGGPRAKVVFIEKMANKTNLCYFDFNGSDSKPQIKYITEAEGAKVPMVSDDGNWVVYAIGDGAEAQGNANKGSQAYLCWLEEGSSPISINQATGIDTIVEPRFVHNDSAKSDQLTVVFGTKPGDQAWETGKTMAVNIDVSGYLPAFGTPWVVYPDGSLTGGLTPDSSYLCAGGGNIAMVDLNSGGAPNTNISSFNQACNASITSSKLKPDMMSYLSFLVRPQDVPNDFIGPNGWGTWDLLLVNDYSGKNIMNFYYPIDELAPKKEWEYYNWGDSSYVSDHAWHHPEWSNHPYFSTAAIEVTRNFEVSPNNYEEKTLQESIYLINMKDSSYLKLVQWDTVFNIPDWYGLYWPCVWVETADTFQEKQDWWVKENNSSSGNNYLTDYNDKDINIKVVNGILESDIPLGQIEIYSITGRLLEKASLNHNKSYNLNAYPSHKPLIILIRNKQGEFVYKTITY
jgi:hypothetical protein